MRHKALAIGVALALAAGPIPAQETAEPAAPNAAPESVETVETDAALSFAQVEEAYLAGDLAAARAGLLPFAEAGRALAQYRLGFMLANGEGGPVDLAGAKRWFAAAAAQNYAPAFLLLARAHLSDMPEIDDYRIAAQALQRAVDDQVPEAHFYLGMLYRTGRGVSADPMRAAELLGVAARAGMPDAQYELSGMYSRGEGVTPDSAIAARWLLQAAEAGQPDAQLSLHFNYSRGTGFPQDPDKAQFWLRAAANGGLTLAERIWGTALLLGDGAQADPAQGIVFLRRAADKGEAAAQANLGFAYLNGIGVAPAPEIAADWYRRAADQGLTRAALTLAQMHEKGLGVETDRAQAIRYYRIAALGQSAEAEVRLGTLVLDGAFDEDEALPEGALDWVAAAAPEQGARSRSFLATIAAAGEPYADLLLAGLFKNGIGGAADPAAAAKSYLRAARAGYVEAQYQLGLLYGTGEGVDLDYVEAHAWMNVAAAGGREDAAQRRDVFATLMSPEEIAEAQTMARRRVRGN